MLHQLASTATRITRSALTVGCSCCQILLNAASPFTNDAPLPFGHATLFS
jgi:hypothetical protein